ERIQNPTCRFHPAKKLYQKGILRGRGPGTNKARCFYCQEAGTQGCVILAAHSFGAPNTKLRHMALSPAVEKHDAGKRKAVVLDCEMVGVLDANDREASEVVRVSAVDFLSGQVLVDTYVQPLERIISWRTRYSGVTRALLTDMKRQGRVVNGWRAARELLWRFIDRETVLIGHSLHNDLLVLGMVHGCVVDSCIVTRDAVGEGCARLWGLRALALQFLEREIQASSSGHDCLEDAFAAREVVLWCLRNDSQLRVWAAAEWEIIAQKQKEKQREKEKDREKSAALAVEAATSSSLSGNTKEHSNTKESI
ncbi:ribonuclease H-like domain-containing protein, partial [Aspergillus varians]